MSLKILVLKHFKVCYKIIEKQRNIIQVPLGSYTSNMRYVSFVMQKQHDMRLSPYMVGPEAPKVALFYHYF